MEPARDEEWHLNPTSADSSSAKSRELLEWLGLAPADLLVYLATGAIAAMFFVRDATADALLAVVGILLALAACPIGTKRDPNVSDFTNGVKSWAYPVCVVLAVGAVIVHYSRFAD